MHASYGAAIISMRINESHKHPWDVLMAFQGNAMTALWNRHCVTMAAHARSTGCHSETMAPHMDGHGNCNGEP